MVINYNFIIFKNIKRFYNNYIRVKKTLFYHENDFFIDKT